MSDRGHPRPSECEQIQGLYVYQDDETESWVAYHNTYTVSSVGDSKQEAVRNCKEALEMKFDDESWYWDDWAMKCKFCDDGRLTPLRYSADDQSDTRVICQSCKKIQRLCSIPEWGTNTHNCPDCDERLDTSDDMLGLVCPDCSSEFEYREITYIVRRDD